MNTCSFIEIKGRRIGRGYTPLVIAEIGINHGGSLKAALAMVDAASRAGAEIIKHQTHIVSDEMSKEAKKVIPGNANVSIYHVMEMCALNEEDENKLKTYCESKGLIFISTPFSRAATDRLVRMNVPAFKIGSGECNNYPLVEYIASIGKPIILSTGMNTIESVAKAVAILKNHCTPFALMHTTNLYPTPPHLVRLGAMQQLMEVFPDVPVGLSDHTTTNHACLAAVALGASLVERHFTDSMDREGPDICCSMDERACRELIEGSTLIKKMLGGIKVPSKEEQVTMNFAFATVVAIKDIKRGEKFTYDNTWVKRPGSGQIHAEHYTSVIGKFAKNDIEFDNHIQWSDVG